MKWLVKAAFLASTMIVVPVALSAQQNSVPDMLGIGEKLGSQGQRITILEQTAQDTKKEIHEFKENVNKQFDEVNKRLDEIKQLIVNSTTQIETRLEAVEHPWGTNVFSNVVTDPLMICSSAFLYLGAGLAKDHKYASYGALSLSAMCLAQTLWNAFDPPIRSSMRWNFYCDCRW